MWAWLVGVPVGVTAAAVWLWAAADAIGDVVRSRRDH